VLFVASRGDSVLESISLASPGIRSRTATGAEPRGIVVLDDGTPVVGHASTRVASIPAPPPVEKKLHVVFQPASEQLDSQAFAPATDGKRAFVALDRISRVDPRDPDADTDDRKPAQFGYGGPTAPRMQTVVATLGPERDRQPEILGKCSLPRASAFDRKRTLLYVACTGTDAVAVIQYTPQPAQVGEDGVPIFREQSTYERDLDVPDGPHGIALDELTGEAFIWSEFARVVTLISGDRTSPVLRLPDRRGDVDKGRAVFHDAGNPAISAAGFACATCHPDGTDDGQVWLVKDEVKAADALRQTPTLAGRIATTDRFGWHGEDPTLDAHLTRTVKRLDGSGMNGVDSRQLAAYVRSLGSARRTQEHAPELVAKGRTLFESDALGCNSCHTEHGRRGGTMGVIREGGPLRSPSLVSVAITGPYLHDGSLETLEDVLTMKQKVLEISLAPEEKKALLAYLVTL
jgi:hypothetical protein